MIEENNISPIRSDFEQIKKQNESGSEYWTSRDLCVALGYSTYQKFTRTINKAIAIASHKRLNIADHFNHMVEMVKLGSGSIRKVENIHLSRMASDNCRKCRWQKATSTNGKRIFQTGDTYY